MIKYCLIVLLFLTIFIFYNDCICNNYEGLVDSEKQPNSCAYFANECEPHKPDGRGYFGHTYKYVPQYMKDCGPNPNIVEKKWCPTKKELEEKCCKSSKDNDVIFKKYKVLRDSYKNITSDNKYNINRSKVDMGKIYDSYDQYDEKNIDQRRNLITEFNMWNDKTREECKKYVPLKNKDTKETLGYCIDGIGEYNDGPNLTGFECGQKLEKNNCTECHEKGCFWRNDYDRNGKKVYNDKITFHDISTMPIISNEHETLITPLEPGTTNMN